MGQLADLLRDSLRELAQSDARRLREMDKLLKELKELEKKPPLQGLFIFPTFSLQNLFSEVFKMAISRRYGNLRSLSRGIGSQIRRGEREKIIAGNPSFDINESLSLIHI